MRNDTITRIPAHPQQPLDWTQNVPLVTAPHKGAATGFNYIAPTPLWSCAALAGTSPTYKSGDATMIGHQPYDATELVIAARTPATPRLLTNYMGYSGVQSVGQVTQSQILMGQLLKAKAKR